MAQEKTKKLKGKDERKGGEKKAKSVRKLKKAPKKKVSASKEKELKGKVALEVKAVELEKKPIRKRATKATKEAGKEKPEQKPTLILPMKELEREEGYTPEEYEEMAKMYDSTMHDIREGELVTGKVIAVTKEDVIVDVGFKSEGVIPIYEFGDTPNVQVGDQVEVFLEAVEDQDGQLVLSKQKADFMRVWDRVKDAYEKGALVEGKLVRRIKGGIVVDVYGVEAFLPGSQIALRQVQDFNALINRKMELKVIKVNKMRRNIVVSRRSVLEEEREKLRAKLLGEIETGQVREGIVKNITDFGVFMDLGGVDGLLHITDMSWGRISHPSELVALGDKIKVKILDFDKKTGRVSLGLKQLTPYPWENIEQKYPVGSKVKGKVVSVTDYGAFVELERGVEGLIHISEMSWTQHIKHPSKLVGVGDIVEVMVLSADKENEKISLGLKQLEPDPWQNLEQKYPVGSKAGGKVRNLTAFGAFVELEEGIDGLIHISDMSWTKRIQHPGEVLKKGDRAEVVILSIDKENRKVSLGYKQLKPDPWPELAKKFTIGTETKGKISRLLDRGVIVELEGEVEGFVPTSQLGKEDLSKPADAFAEKEELPLRVIEFDQGDKRIVLSVNAYYEGKERAELEEYLTKHPIKTVKLEDVVTEIPKVEPPITGEQKPIDQSPPAEGEQGIAG
jgi:small subunit ribosomal protein S1